MLSVAPKIDQLDKFLIKNFPVKTEWVTRLYWPFSPLAAGGHGGEGGRGEFIRPGFRTGKKKIIFRLAPSHSLTPQPPLLSFYEGCERGGRNPPPPTLLHPPPPLSHFLDLKKLFFPCPPFGGRTLASRKKCPLGSFFKTRFDVLLLPTRRFQSRISSLCYGSKSFPWPPV